MVAGSGFAGGYWRVTEVETQMNADKKGIM
jgi:hypothetical protein